MSEDAIDSQNVSEPPLEAAKPKGARKPAKNARAAKKAGRHKKATGNTDRTYRAW